jgi:histidinol-phosphatase
MAALDVIVREAGGRFTSLDGRDGPTGGNALATNGILHDTVLGFLGSVGPQQGRPASDSGTGEPRDPGATEGSADQAPRPGGTVHELSSRRRPAAPEVRRPEPELPPLGP